MMSTKEPWAGPAESEPGVLVILPGSHLGRVQPHSYHPSRRWVHVQDLTTGIHRCEMVADLRLADAPPPSRRRAPSPRRASK